MTNGEKMKNWEEGQKGERKKGKKEKREKGEDRRKKTKKEVKKTKKKGRKGKQGRKGNIEMAVGEKNKIVATFKKCSENASKKVQNSKIFDPSRREHSFHKNPIPSQSQYYFCINTK